MWSNHFCTYIYNIDGSFYKNPNIENTSNIRVKSKFYDPNNCVKNLQKDLSLKVIDYKLIKVDQLRTVKWLEADYPVINQLEKLHLKDNN